ncbi:MAG: aminotransferase class V-fold PLP-dependent enzyme [Cyclobacteriaceae bacterium]|nr:aminotransferase class V-fold PLP-dependent enzyme [Cyclobacteriaceae bacterium]
MMNIDEIRKDTPGCASKIHFNNAGASLPTSAVTDAIRDYISFESLTGGYEAADIKKAEIQEFYNSAARLVNTHENNIAFTSSATNSFSLALSSIPFERGDKVLIANEDYISNQIAFLSLQHRLGIQLIRAKSLSTGGVDLDDMEGLINKHHPKLVSLTHVPTNTGLIQPVEAVGKMCNDKGILYLVDACQSVGQIPVDIKKIGCDFLTATMRKFLRGPRGAGFLYASDRVLKEKLTPLFVDMRGAEWTGADTYEVRMNAKRFEEWELPYALVVGSKEAINYALNLGIENIAERNKTLCGILRAKLNSIELKVLDLGKHQSSIITIEMPGRQPNEVLEYLRAININTSTTHRSNAQIDFASKKVDWALRISPHYFSTEDEIDSLIQSLEDLND